MYCVYFPKKKRLFLDRCNGIEDNIHDIFTAVQPAGIVIISGKKKLERCFGRHQELAWACVTSPGCLLLPGRVTCPFVSCSVILVSELPVIFYFYSELCVAIFIVVTPYYILL
jgi:hypothetical protein